MPLLGHTNDVAYLVLVAIFAVGGTAILVLTWRDSLRLMREFFSPLTRPGRPRFGLMHLFVFVAGCSLLIRIATFWRWSEFAWEDNIGFVAAVVFVLSIVACFVHLFLADTSDPRRKIRGSEIAPPIKAEGASEARKRKLRIRFPHKHRQTSAFKW